jgi:hypothetical protein
MRHDLYLGEKQHNAYSKTTALQWNTFKITGSFNAIFHLENAGSTKLSVKLQTSRPQGVTAKNILLFVVTAVRTADVTK